MRVFAHEVDCWPVFFVLFKSQRCSVTLIFVIFRQQYSSAFVFSTDNAKFKRKYCEQAVQMYLCQWLIPSWAITTHASMWAIYASFKYMLWYHDELKSYIIACIIWYNFALTVRTVIWCIFYYPGELCLRIPQIPVLAWALTTEQYLSKDESKNIVWWHDWLAYANNKIFCEV